MSSQPNPPTPLDLEALRALLDSSKGPQFWRSLDDAAQTPEFQAYIDNEFTDGTSEWTNPVSRRRLLELLGASLGLAGLTSCTKQPPEYIVPYVNAPEDVVPGKPLFFATAIPHLGVAQPVLVESHMGRPTKIEGNPEHPASLGSTSVFTQAATLGLYDPDRAQNVLREGRNSTWVRFQEAMKLLREELLASKGAGFRILTETVTSPTLAALIGEVLAAFPEARWHQYEAGWSGAARAGAKLAFGEDLHPVYRFDQADVVVSLDADFLACGPASVRYARDFSSRRRAEVEPDKLNRLYVVEPSPSLTGAKADHRVAASSAEVGNFARALAGELGAAGITGSTKVAAKFLKAVAADLKAHAGSSLVVAGDHQPPAVHAVAHAINAALGNVGKTVSYVAPLEAGPGDQMESIRQLAADMAAGRVSTLLVAGGNPMYNAPADTRFADAFRKVKLRIRLADYDDETSAVCHWQIPMAHPLESWGDLRASDGSVVLQQPLIAPLYEGKTLADILLLLLDRGGREIRDVVKEHWAAALRDTIRPENFEAYWQKSVHDGFLAGVTAGARDVKLRADVAAAAGAGGPGQGTEINIRPCPSVFDGRFANNAWLQELPRPISKVVWDNVVWMSPAMAGRLGVENGSVVELKAGAAAVAGPVWIVPGQADDAVTVTLGYGRTRGGRIANGVGFSVNPIRTSSAPWITSGEIRKTGESLALASTQDHGSMEGRRLIRYATAAEYKRNEHFAADHHAGKLFSIYPDFEYKGHSWGMAIDLNACTGCNACTIACQAENNIPVVGKDQVIRGREMHWIRIDRYFEGSLDNPEIHHQPVTCMHCENAPCEPVCPVAATTHSEEGLNQMTYNRCVGTRYCSNNCPYKVRRFNFFLYNDWDTQSLYGLRNPNVTVRSRGVMEKCTYCVQRINAARIEAEKEGRRIRDGEVVTACQAVCPSQAIYFGDLNDPSSKVARIKKDHRNYALLTDLNTRPRTSYIGKVTNPNPDLEKA